MRKILSILSLFISVLVQAQSQYDYMDDDAVAGGADRALNAFIILFFIVIAFIFFIYVYGGITKIMYEFSPQKEIDRQKKEKEEQEKQERLRKEQERQKALLALPENKIHLSVVGVPHPVELARGGHRILPEMVAICLWSINKIIWNNTDITNQIGYKEISLEFIYAKHYKSDDSCLSNMSELMVSKDCVNITNKLNACTFDIEFTIRGNFNPQKLQIIHCIHYGGLRFAIERDIKCLEFISYDGDIIQTHLTNGKPLCFPYEGYISYQKIIDKLPPYNQVPEGQMSDIISDTT